MQHDNLSILTQSHKAIAAKKRARKDQIKEVVFDEDARKEFLTGFHKRKVAKKEAAKKKAQLRERQDRLESRRQQRRALAERAAQNAAEVEKAYGAVIDDECGPSSDDDEKEIEEEYEGEEQLATVTVVEDFDPSALLHGQPTTSAPPTDRNVLVSQPPVRLRGKEKEKLKQDGIKTKSKLKRNDKVKYQTKAARSAERSKQRARRTEKAERAGGKAARKRKRR